MFQTTNQLYIFSTGMRYESFAQIYSWDECTMQGRPVMIWCATGLSTGAHLLKCGYTLLQKDPIELSLNIFQKFNIYMESGQPLVPLLF